MLFSMPDIQTKHGRRDLTLLVNCWLGLKLEIFPLGKLRPIKLFGKGNKARIVPITQKAPDMLQGYIKEKSFLLFSRLNACCRNQAIVPAIAQPVFQKSHPPQSYALITFSKIVYTPRLWEPCQKSRTLHVIVRSGLIPGVAFLCYHAEIRSGQVRSSTLPAQDNRLRALYRSFSSCLISFSSGICSNMTCPSGY